MQGFILVLTASFVSVVVMIVIYYESNDNFIRREAKVLAVKRVRPYVALSLDFNS